MAISETVVPLDAPVPAASVDRSSSGITLLFGATAFVGAALLFVVQPLVARLILPSYGGSATVWSTSSLFFQVLLLLAYGYAHWSTARGGRQWQPRAHLVVLLLPVLVLPVAIPGDAAPGADVAPALWLLRTLVLMVGLPFAVLATTGPLLQRWYSWGDHRRSGDPYFLFAASNLGSFGGLLAYPLLVEPNLTLAAQRSWWSAGFLVFVLLTGACALSVRRCDPRPGAGSGRTQPSSPDARHRAPGPSPSQVLVWMGLAFLPSSLMLGVTAHLSTDVAAIPLLWVVPLAIYLASFVVAFARTSRAAPSRMTRAAVAVTFLVAVTSVGSDTMPVSVSIGLNLLMLALVAYAAHARLATTRPPPEHLTGYYLVVATGGALGGLLNGLIAPMVLDRVLEYPLVLTAVPLLLLGLSGGDDSWLVRQVQADPVRAVALAVTAGLLPVLLQAGLWASATSLLATVAMLSGALVVGWGLTRLPGALVFALVVFFVVATVGDSRGVLERSRTFFGSYTVVDRGGLHELVHGTTVHGTQFRTPSRRNTPTAYYSRTGPLGDVLALRSRSRVAAVGLGAGTVAAYGSPGQELTFFEIDPEIVRIASDPELFSYLADSPATIKTVVADGRLGLESAAPGSYDAIVLDAFSSDAIPVHLLTEEAMRTYVERLSPDGILVVHISNRAFDLEPVLAGNAQRLGLSAAIGRGGAGPDGATESVWVALGGPTSGVTELAASGGWDELGQRRVHWTDDYSSVLSVLR